MMGKSKIEWTDVTWSPVTGCTKVSAGCKHCYAERMIGRFQSLHGYGLPTLEGDAVDPPRFHEVQLHPERLDHPLHWRKPRKVFVCSMSDLFHERVPDEFIGRVFSRMMETPWHTYQILTKRPERMARIVSKIHQEITQKSLLGLDHVWLGVSVEDQQTADARIPLLLQTPAAVRFVSVEPMLKPVDLSGWMWGRHIPCKDCPMDDECGCGYEPRSSLEGETSLSWVICGGESGPQARPMHPDWARSLRDQCQAAGVPFFMKQICDRGRKIPFDKFPCDLQVREFPNAKR